ESVLPDARAWEIVSPLNKNGALIEGINEGALQASEEGDSISYLVRAPIGTRPVGNAQLTQILSTRGPTGWSSQDISTPHDAATGVTIGLGQEYRIFSPDLSRGLVEPFGETPLSPGALERTVYIRNNTTCEAVPATCYVPLVTPGNVPLGTK